MPAASVEFNGFIPATSGAEQSGRRKQGVLGRFFRAVHDAQVRRAEREIARFIEVRGGRMTDDLERKIERHFV